MTCKRDNNWVGYCTNVHSGTDLDSVIANLERYAIPIQKTVRKDKDLGIGLWLSNEAARGSTNSISRLKHFLETNRLRPFTFNAFPYSNFHQPVVKHNVYLPGWDSQDRLEYTKSIATIANELLPAQQPATISTLPLGWPGTNDNELKCLSAAQLKLLAKFLETMEQTHDRRIVVCIEPEPGCVLQTSSDIVRFFQQNLLDACSNSERELLQRYIGVCHDICHSAVMFEDQKDVLDLYASQEIFVGKVQVSSAIGNSVNAANASTIFAELAAFAEPKYLHQTLFQTENETMFFEDLPLALASFQRFSDFEFRSHFHVPVFAQQIGEIKTTQAEIEKCVSNLSHANFLGHFEIETYAWSVSPDTIRATSLGETIEQELVWFDQLLEDLKGS